MHQMQPGENMTCPVRLCQCTKQFTKLFWSS